MLHRPVVRGWQSRSVTFARLAPLPVFAQNPATPCSDFIDAVENTSISKIEGGSFACENWRNPLTPMELGGNPNRWCEME